MGETKFGGGRVENEFNLIINKIINSKCSLKSHPEVRKFFKLQKLGWRGADAIFDEELKSKVCVNGLEIRKHTIQADKDEPKFS